MTYTVTAAEARKLLGKPKRSKYRAVRTQVDGIWFDSKAEARHYATLKQHQTVTRIKNLRVHPRYPLHVNGKKLGDLVLDFAFIDADGKPRFQDVKGVLTRHSKWKIAHFEAQYSAEVELIGYKPPRRRAA